MKYTHILYDLDNTILDFNEASKKAFKSMMKVYELNHIPDLYSIYKVVNKQVWRALEEGKITQDTLRARRWNLFFEEIGVTRDGNTANDLYLENLVTYAHLIPGAIDVLQQGKHAGLSQTIVTNGLKEVQRIKIEKYKLAQYFDHTVISDEIGVAKPHKGFFDHAFNLLDYPDKDKVLIVGDTITSDIKGGVDYGLDTCWYNYDGGTNKSTISPTYTIHQISEIKEIILPR